MPLLRVTNDLIINPAAVSYMEWDRRSYANCAGDSVLVITMTDGREHRIAHRPQYLDGNDCCRIEAKIMEATNGAC